jgi:hypothetical protein
MNDQVKTAGKARVQVGIAPHNLPISNPQNISAVYANHIGASGTLTDFTLYFLEISQVPNEKGSAARQELKAAVTLPFALAEGLAQVLKQIVDGHKSAMDQAAAVAKASEKK